MIPLRLRPRPAFAARSCLLAVVAYAAIIAPAGAQTAANSLQLQIDDAFRQVLNAPGDVELGLRYARLLVQAGNFEGGVAAMERLLLAPNPPPSLRVELAVLYYRLASYAAAEVYLRDALADPALPEALRRQAQALLADVGRRNQTHRLSGFVMAGLRGQTNPTARTDEDFLKAGGALVPRTASQKPDSDTDVQLVGRLEHVWDLETQNGAELVSTLLGVASHYSSVSSYKLTATPTKPRDLLLLEATSGIRFKPDPVGVPDWTLRPYAIAGNILLDGHQYAYSLGAGLDSSYRLTERFLFDTIYELRHYSYATRIDVTEAKAQGGFEHTLRLRASYELAPGHLGVAELVGRDHNADRGYFAYQSGEARLSYVASYPNPFGWDDRAWTTTLSSGLLARYYDAADPAVDRAMRRDDTEWRSSISTLVPVSEGWSILLQGEYTKASSNLPNYRYSNLSGLASILWRF